MADRYTVRRETLEAIADKIREKKYIDDPLTPAQMVEEMDELGYGIRTSYPNMGIPIDPWVRPPEYPDPTVLDLTDFDGLYLTYDLRKTPGYGWIGVWVDNAITGHRVYIERGHISNNEFVVDESNDVAEGTYFRHDLDDTYGDVQLWRVRSEGHILRVAFIPNTDTAANNYINTLQPVVERYGRLPYTTNLGSTVNAQTATAGSWSLRFLEREDVKDVTSVTNMASAYYQSYNLREIHLDGWDTSKVTSFASCFNACYRLPYIPVANIRTDSATVLASMFQDCWSLDNVDIDHFNIDKVTSMNSMFLNCRSLRHLEMSRLRGTGRLTNIQSLMSGCYMLENISRNVRNLNVENVTSLYYAFTNCMSVHELDLSSWDVSKVTSLRNFVSDCLNLEVLDVTGWDVTKVTTLQNAFQTCIKLRKIIGIEDWELPAITNLQNVFYDCHCLESFKIKTWDISNVTTVNSMFRDCYSLKEVELEGWDIPNVITDASYMFSHCRCLASLHLPDMDFTAEDGTAFSDFLNCCYSLSDLDISGWHIARIATFAEFFYTCTCLREIDLTDWVVDSGEMNSKASLNYVFNGLYACESIKIHFSLEIVTTGTITNLFTNSYGIKHIDLRNWDVSLSTNSSTPNSPMLEEYYPPKLYPVNQTYTDARSLTPASLVRILEALPEVAANSRTITLGLVNKLKLTEEQLAIATNKGWKVA